VVEGATVVFSYAHDEQAAKEVAEYTETTGRRAVAIQAELRSPGAPRGLFQAAEEAVGTLDILVNNAGRLLVLPVAETSDEQLEELLALNFKAPFALIGEAARRLREGGRIVNVSSANTVLVGFAPMAPGLAAYTASKAALEALTRVAAAELGSRGITVNAVLPGSTDTDMFRSPNPEGGDPTVAAAGIAAITPLGRIGQPGDVADVIAYLLTEQARWLTGQCIRATGGLV
jgi:3-oxoacyl-[acyl-carrier protein] reductase